MGVGRADWDFRRPGVLYGRSAEQRRLQGTYATDGSPREGTVGAAKLMNKPKKRGGSTDADT